MITALTDENFEEILSKERISVVKVYATWCGPCKFLNTHFKKWSENYKNFKDVDICFHEVDNDKCSRFIEKYKTDSLPSIIFMVHGCPVFVIKGITRQTVFEEMLSKTLEVDFKVEKEG